MNEIYKPISRQRGLVIRAKFELYKRHIPGLLHSFQQLLMQVLSQDARRLHHWRSLLVSAVGANGRVLTDVIPDLERLIGIQPILPLLDPMEAENRFNRTFISFVSVFAKPEHPLVILIDDLQWTDATSLNLIKLLYQQDSLALLVVGAYRDN